MPIKSCRSRNEFSEGDHEKCKEVLQRNALVMVVREMGNGVDRIEIAQLTPIEEVMPERSLPGRYPLVIEMESRMDDLLRSALRSLGYTPDCTDSVPDGFVRAITDDRIMVAMWLIGP